MILQGLRQGDSHSCGGECAEHQRGAPAQLLPPASSACFHLLGTVLAAPLPDSSCWAVWMGTQCLCFSQHPGLCCRLRGAALPGPRAGPASSKYTNSREVRRYLPATATPVASRKHKCLSLSRISLPAAHFVHSSHVRM